MAYPAYIREKARELRRKKQLTIDELAERLALPRTTIYYWVRDLPIDRKPATCWPATAHAAAARSNRVGSRRFGMRLTPKASPDSRNFHPIQVSGTL
jgi:transcriptional regulator with XRE-family HTH domain